MFSSDSLDAKSIEFEGTEDREYLNKDKSDEFYLEKLEKQLIKEVGIV